MRGSLRRTFFSPERPTLTSRSLQSFTRPFQKRFREVFGNARILIFYLSIKAWEEKSLPKSQLGWFFLVFYEGKATKENISIFWFIWPLSVAFYKMSRDVHRLCSHCYLWHKPVISIYQIFLPKVIESFFYANLFRFAKCARAYEICKHIKIEKNASE